MTVPLKLIQRWAKIYVDLLTTNKEKAKEWSNRFLPKEMVNDVAEEAKVILRKRGYKVVD